MCVWGWLSERIGSEIMKEPLVMSGSHSRSRRLVSVGGLSSGDSWKVWGSNLLSVMQCWGNESPKHEQTNALAGISHSCSASYAHLLTSTEQWPRTFVTCQSCDITVCSCRASPPPPLQPLVTLDFVRHCRPLLEKLNSTFHTRNKYK